MPEASPNDRLRAAVDELYGLEPSGFVARRDQLAKHARVAGDRALANAIQGLRRPTVGAWYLNIAARAPLASFHAFGRIGRRLRAAQQAGDFAAVMELGRDRGEAERRVLADLAAHVAHLGYPVSTTALEEVRSTLRATLADEDAARAALSSALVKPIASAAPDTAWFGPALSPVPSRPPEAPDGPENDETGAGVTDLDAVRARRARRAEHERLRALASAAAARAGAAEAEASVARQRAADAEARCAELDARIDELRRQLDGLIAEHAAQAQELSAARARAEAAASGRDDARAEAARALADLETFEA